MKEAATPFAVTGAELACQRTGAGPTVLFVHGSASDARTWDAAVQAVSRRFEALRYSRRFHRPNPPIGPGESYDYAQHLEDLLAVLDALDRPLTMVGHSSGGLLALLAAARRPAIVKRLVLVEPAIFGRVLSDPPRPAEIARLAVRDPVLAASLIRFALTSLEPARRAARRGERDAALRLFGRGVLGRRAFARLSPERLRQAEENFFMAELLGPPIPSVSEAEVRAVRCPTLVVAGADSPTYFRRLALRLAAELPDGRSLVLPGAAHIVHEDAPQAFNTALLAFLANEEGR